MEEKIRLYTVRSLEQKTFLHPENVQNFEKQGLEYICVWYGNGKKSNTSNQKHMKKRLLSHCFVFDSISGK